MTPTSRRLLLLSGPAAVATLLTGCSQHSDAERAEISAVVERRVSALPRLEKVRVTFLDGFDAGYALQVSAVRPATSSGQLVDAVREVLRVLVAVAEEHGLGDDLHLLVTVFDAPQSDGGTELPPADQTDLLGVGAGFRLATVRQHLES